MTTIDLNAMRAARTEAQREPVDVQWGDKTFRILPERLTLKLQDAIEGPGVMSGLRVLLGEEQATEFINMDPEPDVLDGLALVTEAIKVLSGRSPGESGASPNSLTNGGRSARQTSNGSTDSTSPQPATAPTHSQ